MKLTCLVLPALFCIGLGLATEPSETEDELHERTLGEIGHLFHEGLLQLLPHHPRHNLRPLMNLYYLIQVISAYHHSPAHYHTDIESLVQDLVDEDFQERLRWAIRRLHRFENLKTLREHPSIAENPRDKESFANDLRRLLPAIHRALKAIHLERLHDAGLRTRLKLLLHKCEVLSAEVTHTEFALLTLLGVPPVRGVLLEGREALEERLLRKPGHGLGLHHHHHLHHHPRPRPSHGVHHHHHHKSPSWHSKMNHQHKHLQKYLRQKMAHFNKILHDKKAIVAGIVDRQKQFVKELLDKKVDLQTLVDDVVANYNEQRRVFTETMNKNGEVVSELVKDGQEYFNSSASQVSGSFTEMLSNVSVASIVDATKGVVTDALHKKQNILKKVFHKPSHHHKHNHKHHHKHHGINPQKGLVTQLIETKAHLVPKVVEVVERPVKIVQPVEVVSHHTDEHNMEDRYEYENERYEFKPEYYESQDPEEKPSGRKLDAEELETSEELQRLDKDANRLWITEEPESRMIDNDDEVTLDYWTPAPAGKTTTTVRPVYEEDLEAATAQSEPIWLDVRGAEDRSDNHEKTHTPDEDHREEPSGKQYKSEIELPALYQVSTRILDIVAMLEDGAGFKGLNENISSNDMALIVNHLAQQELEKMEEDRGITQPELIGGLKWLIEFKEVPDYERMLDVLELWRQAELQQIKENAKNRKHPEKTYLVKVTDELEDDLGEDDGDYDDEDYEEWEEAPVPEADDDTEQDGSTVPDDVIKSTGGMSGGISKDVKRSQPFPEEDPDLTEPLKEKSPVDQETKRIQPFPEERPDETEPLEMV